MSGTGEHDRIFRHAFSEPLVARQFLTTWLPENFSSLVDWSTLEIRKITGINPALAERREDLVYRVRTAGQSIWFYLLLEHQTQPDRWMSLRALEYTILAWQEHRKETGSSERLPLVIPVVIYPGLRQWGKLYRLRNLIEIPHELASWAENFAPDCGFCLVELAGLPLEKLADGQLARAILGALQGEKGGPMGYEKVNRLVEEIFAEPQRAAALRIADHLWQYLLHHSELQKQEVSRIVQKTIPAGQRKKFMSTAEMLRQEGRTEGRTEGILAGRVQTCQQILGRTETPAEELLALTPEGLQQLYGQLQSEIALRLKVGKVD